MKLIAALSLLLTVEVALSAVLQQPRVAGLLQDDVDDDLYKLPDSFLFGAGLSAFQSEGAIDVDGKSESVMQYVVGSSKNGFKENADVSADHYHRYKEDLALAKQMKFTSHRFSIAWTRIFPNGDDTPNPDGVKFYHDYIQEIRDNGMEPLVTMYHFDHPLSLERETTGWTSKTMVDKFVKFADYLFETYGSKVKYWNPLNEANMYCIYMLPLLANADVTPTNETSYYDCLHHTILAHAKVYALYKAKYYASQNGMVGTSVLLWPGEPYTTDYSDLVASNIFTEMLAGMMVHPIVNGGQYSPTARYLIDKRSKEHGLAKSKLPYFTEEEQKKYFSGVATDFLGINVYSSFQVTLSKNSSDTGKLSPMLEPVIEDMPEVKVISGGGFAQIDSTLMRKSLLWAWNNYHVPIVFSENGQGDSTQEGVHDVTRTTYHTAMLRSLISTMNEYHIPVISYHVWALLDLYEFQGGYTQRPFGLIHVDYEQGTLDRTIKDSAQVFIQMAETRRAPSSAISFLAPSMVLVVLLNLFCQALAR